MRQECRRLCSMRPGHARDNYYGHIEIHLPASACRLASLAGCPQRHRVLITADHRNGGERTDEARAGVHRRDDCFAFPRFESSAESHTDPMSHPHTDTRNWSAALTALCLVNEQGRPVGSFELSLDAGVAHSATNVGAGVSGTSHRRGCDKLAFPKPETRQLSAAGAHHQSAHYGIRTSSSNATCGRSPVGRHTGNALARRSVAQPNACSA